MRKRNIIMGCLVVVMMMVVTVVTAGDVSATEKRKMESELKSLQSKLQKARMESPRSLEKQIKDLEGKLGVKPEATQSEVSLGVELVSAYVFRGATFNDGFVIQPGLDVAGLPLDIGVWANVDIDDYDGAANDGQFSEIDVYVSYSLPLPTEKVGVSVGYCEYTYPGWGGDATVTDGGTATESVEVAPGEADREIGVSVEIDAPLAPSVSFNWGVDGGIEKLFYTELGVGHEVSVSDDASLSLGLAVGYVNDGNEGGESGLSHFNASASLAYKMISIGGTYVGQIDEDVLPDVEDGGPYDVSFYVSMGISHSF